MGLKQRIRRKNSDTIETAIEIKTFPEPMSGCFLWYGSVNRDGYPRLRWKGKIVYVHRIAYTMHYGTEPGDLMVCHKCDNPGCINPDHLFLGTALDNNRDRSRKGRTAQLFGDAHPNIVLSDAQVIAIRAEYVRGSPLHSTNALARKYGVHQATIWNIISGKSRPHLLEAS